MRRKRSRSHGLGSSSEHHIRLHNDFVQDANENLRKANYEISRGSCKKALEFLEDAIDSIGGAREHLASSNEAESGDRRDVQYQLRLKKRRVSEVFARACLR